MHLCIVFMHVWSCMIHPVCMWVCMSVCNSVYIHLFCICPCVDVCLQIELNTSLKPLRFFPSTIPHTLGSSPHLCHSIAMAHATFDQTRKVSHSWTRPIWNGRLWLLGMQNRYWRVCKQISLVWVSHLRLQSNRIASLSWGYHEDCHAEWSMDQLWLRGILLWCMSPNYHLFTYRNSRIILQHHLHCTTGSCRHDGIAHHQWKAAVLWWAHSTEFEAVAAKGEGCSASGRKDFWSILHPWNEVFSQVWVKLRDWCPMLKVLNYIWLDGKKFNPHFQFVLVVCGCFSCWNYLIQTQIRFRSSTGASMCIAALQPVACFFFSAWQVQGSQATTAAVQCHAAPMWSVQQVPLPHTPSQQFQLAEPIFHRFTHQSPLQ